MKVKTPLFLLSDYSEHGVSHYTKTSFDSHTPSIGDATNWMQSRQTNPFVLVNSSSDSSLVSRFTVAMPVEWRRILSDLYPRQRKTWRKNVINSSSSNERKKKLEMYLQRSNLLSDGSLYYFQWRQG